MNYKLVYSGEFLNASNLPFSEAPFATRFMTKERGFNFINLEKMRLFSLCSLQLHEHTCKCCPINALSMKPMNCTEKSLH